MKNQEPKKQGKEKMQDTANTTKSSKTDDKKDSKKRNA